jgi:hypothetical protein
MIQMVKEVKTKASAKKNNMALGERRYLIQ